MMMGKLSFPGWLGPLLGPILGASVAVEMGGNQAGNRWWEYAIIGAILGFLGGVVVWLNDALQKKQKKLPNHGSTEEE